MLSTSLPLRESALLVGRKAPPHTSRLPRTAGPLRPSHTQQINNGRASRFSCSALPSFLPWESVEALQAALASSSPGLAAGTLANTTVFVLGLPILLKGLSFEGVLHASVLGSMVYSAFGLGGYLLVCLYFILGTAVTKIKMKQKEAEGIAEKKSGRRGPGSVWGSGAAGTLAAALALALGDPTGALRVGFVASFASKLSDTCSSEIGKAYGKNTFLVTTFAAVPRGTEGAVSVEGTAAGMVAAVLFSGLAFATGQLGSPVAAVIVTTAAVVSNYLESVLGATVQGKVEWLTNDIINVIQITIGAGLAIGLTLLIG